MPLSIAARPAALHGAMIGRALESGRMILPLFCRLTAFPVQTETPIGKDFDLI